ncbi:MAG: iron-containing alcohol dehydrogenase [Chloroflexaceae bacterium]|nr:iron-containing alcohol dehydrogenase [Chloroflexaceae bacterium]
MLDFSYYNPVKLLYGKGKLDAVAEEILPYGKRVLFVFGQNHLKASGQYDRVKQLLEAAGIESIDLGGVHSNPRLDLVQRGIQICKEQDIDFILAVGGGSSCDTAKAISMGAKADYDIWQAYEDFHNLMHGNPLDNPHVPTEVVPMGVVMTKPATGSDFDYTSVLSNWDAHEKLMVINKVMYPKFSIHDPTLTYTLPREQIVYGVADIMTHYLEQYLTPDDYIDMLDRMKEVGLKTVIDSGVTVLKNPEDYNAQSNLLYCAALACSDISMQGTLGGWEAHMIEHELSAITDVNHGLGMAIVYIGWMKYVIDANPRKFAEFAEWVWGIERRRSDLEIGMAGIEKTAEFWRSLGIPLTLREAGLDPAIIPQVAKQAVRFGPLGRLKTLYEEDVIKILESVS